MNRNGGGAPRRPAPPPPSSTSSSRQSSYGSTRTVAKTSQASATKSNGTGKETVIVVQRKSSKKMPLLMRKLKINKKHDAASGDVQTSTSTSTAASATVATNGSAAHRSESNNSNGAASNSIRRVSASSLLKYSHSRSNYREIQSRPMIIRPGSNQLAKKKSAPPRPPPPKIIRPETSSSGPPSYDDVLRADLSAFMGEAKAPRPKPKAPTRPPSFSIPTSTTSRHNDLLIDFDAPPTSSSVNGIGGADQLPKSLLDLDIIAGPSNSLITNDLRQMPRSSSYGFADPWNDVNNSVVLRRGGSVPGKPGASLRGDDWLQSCLRESVHGTFTNVNALNSVASSPPPPPLPPRPRLVHGSPVATASSARIQLFGLDDMSAGDLEDSSSPSPEPPISTPPPVPPLPADDGAFNFQLEASDDDETPPLPPRPKLCDASRPQAVALYDYAASQSDDLSFRAGDVITLVHKVNDLWLYGAIGEREGLFPKNFVNVVVPLSDGNAIKQKDEIEGPRCRAIYDFVGENDGELSFGVGEVLSLKERVGNDWFRGTLNDNLGLFPVSYVEVLEDLPSSEDFSDREYCHVGVRRSMSDNLTAGPLCVALYDFTGEPGELTFGEGDEIEVTAVVNDDWFMGRKLRAEDQTTAQGRFPKNFVQLL